MNGLLKEAINMFFDKYDEIKKDGSNFFWDYVYITTMYTKEGKVYRAEVKKESRDHVLIEEPYVITDSKCEGYFPQVAIPYTVGKIHLKAEMKSSGLIVRVKLMPTLKKHQEIMMGVNYMYEVVCGAKFDLTGSWTEYDSGIEKGIGEMWGENRRSSTERVVHKRWYDEEILPFMKNLVENMRTEVIKNREMCLWYRDRSDFK